MPREEISSKVKDQSYSQQQQQHAA